MALTRGESGSPSILAQHIWSLRAAVTRSLDAAPSKVQTAIAIIPSIQFIHYLCSFRSTFVLYAQ